MKKYLQVETVTLKDGSKMDVIRDIAAVDKLLEENEWLTRLVETIRDKSDLRYCGERGLLAFSKLKDDALKSINVAAMPNEKS